MALHNEILKRQIWEFFCNDMDSCLEVSKEIQIGNNTRFKGGLNYASALIIFSVIDMLSSYFCGKKATSSTATAFLNKYMGKYNDLFKNTAFCKKFYEVFRHGISHQWSPKFSGIDMRVSNPLIYIADGDKVTVLTIPTFYNNLKLAIKDYENDLNNNKELLRKFHIWHKNIQEKDKEEMEKLKQLMLSQKR